MQGLPGLLWTDESAAAAESSQCWSAGRVFANSDKRSDVIHLCPPSAATSSLGVTLTTYVYCLGCAGGMGVGQESFGVASISLVRVPYVPSFSWRHCYCSSRLAATPLAESVHSPRYSRWGLPASVEWWAAAIIGAHATKARQRPKGTNLRIPDYGTPYSI